MIRICDHGQIRDHGQCQTPSLIPPGFLCWCLTSIIGCVSFKPFCNFTIPAQTASSLLHSCMCVSVVPDAEQADDTFPHDQHVLVRDCSPQQLVEQVLQDVQDDHSVSKIRHETQKWPQLLANPAEGWFRDLRLNNWQHSVYEAICCRSGK